MNDRRSQIELSTKVIDSYGKSCVYTNAHQHTHSLSLSLSLFQSMSYSLMFKSRYTERLKNTLIHEMCHAAVWIVDGIKDGGHRRHWRAW